MSHRSDDLRVVPAAPEHAAGLAALFERVGSTCYCRFWHFEGDKNAWLARTAHHAELNRDQMIEALEQHSDQMLGVVASAADARIVGWLKVAPQATLQKMYAQRLYRGLPCFNGDRTGVYAIGCVLVDPSCRRQSVSRQLLFGALDLAQSLGARAIEAFPRRSETATAEELWNGPPNILFEAGFEEVHAFAPYPVLRKMLDKSLTRAVGTPP